MGPENYLGNIDKWQVSHVASMHGKIFRWVMIWGLDDVCLELLGQLLSFISSPGE